MKASTKLLQILILRLVYARLILSWGYLVVSLVWCGVIFSSNGKVVYVKGPASDAASLLIICPSHVCLLSD